MVKKLVILAFEDDKFRKSAGRYVAQINPEKYSEDLTVEYDVKQKVNPAGVTAKFKGLGPRNLSLDFVLDDTGVVEDPKGSAAKTVSDRILEFQKIAYDFDGEIHSPRYLRLLWGALQFDCRLTKLDIDYTLFNPGGRPLRAVLKAQFLHFAPALKTELQGRKKSSDLTRVRQVGAADTLPLMCHRVYGDSKLYPRVAQFNELTNFRDLPLGRTIKFPPLAELTRGGGGR